MTLSINELITPSVPVSDIRSAGNVRVDVGDVTELAASIEETGLHQPLEVAVGDDTVWLIDGHRRLAAVRTLGWTDVPVTVAAELDGMNPEEQRIAVQLVANMQRVDLTPLEEASGYAQLKGYGWKQSQIARRVGRSEAHVSKRLSLLDLPETAIDLAEQGRLGPESLYQLSQAKSAGGNVDGIVAQLAENHQDDDEPIVSEEVEMMTRGAIRDAKAQTELSARKVEYEERGIGVKVVDTDTFNNPALPSHPRIGWKFEIDWDAHLAEPCALMCLWIQHGTVVESQHCLNPDTHEPDGASKLKLPEKKQSEEQKRKAAARRRSKALTAAAEVAMEGRLPARDRVVERMAALYLDRLSANAHRYAARFLGMEAELEDEYKGLSRLYADADSTWKTKILLAAVLAHGQEQSSGTWVDGPDSDHLAFLADIGAPYTEEDK